MREQASVPPVLGDEEVRVPGGLPMMLVISPEAIPLLSEDSWAGRAARRFALQAAQYGRKAGVGVLISRETADRISGPGSEVQAVLGGCGGGVVPEIPDIGRDAAGAAYREPGSSPMVLVISPEAIPLLSEDSWAGRAARRFALQAAQYGRKAGVGVLISRETADRISGPGREVRDVLQMCSYGPGPESPRYWGWRR